MQGRSQKKIMTEAMSIVKCSHNNNDNDNNNNNNNNNNNKINIYPGSPLAYAVFSGTLQIIIYKKNKIKTSEGYQKLKNLKARK